MNMVTRRTLLRATGASALSSLLLPAAGVRAAQATPTANTIASLVIDVANDPDTIDPAMAYSSHDWSIVHAIHDGLVTIGPDGTIQGLAAETFEAIDELTYEARLRDGLTFHDGSPVTADAAIRGVEHLQGGESLVADLFSPIVDIERVDDLTVRLVLDAPAPWLPAQLAVWHMLLPEGATPDSLANEPVGCGPFRLVEWEQGSVIRLERFDAYQPVAAKGAPVADEVTYRFVPEASTRVADMLSGAAQIASEIPLDQVTALESGGVAVAAGPIVGSGWIRIATDVEPFDDVRVRQALNLALDVDALAEVFIGDEAHRIASIHPDERSMGFAPDLEPYAYDPDAARALLEEAGIRDGLNAVLEATPTVPLSMLEAIASQWSEVGIQTEIAVSEYGAFNATWADPEAPALRMSTWSPLYDPHTLLDLVFKGGGYLSRYDNDEASALISEAAVETDLDAREHQYQDLAKIMHEDGAAIFLWNLVAHYGLAGDAVGWTPRGDEYVLPLARG